MDWVPMTKLVKKPVLRQYSLCRSFRREVEGVNLPHSKTTVVGPATMVHQQPKGKERVEGAAKGSSKSAAGSADLLKLPPWGDASSSSQ